MQTLILVLVLQCSTRLATCNFSKNELIAEFATVSMSLKFPGIQDAICLCLGPEFYLWCGFFLTGSLVSA